jgi:hypothetical protein
MFAVVLNICVSLIWRGRCYLGPWRLALAAGGSPTRASAPGLEASQLAAAWADLWLDFEPSEFGLLCDCHGVAVSVFSSASRRSCIDGWV